MKENVDKYLNNLAKKVLKEGQIESPNFNFTDAILSQVNALKISKTLVYRPLISKKAWVLISMIFLAIIIYTLLSGNQTGSLDLFGKIDFSFLTINPISSLKLSKILMYAVVFFGLMICIQILLLKNHFDRRFEV